MTLEQIKPCKVCNHNGLMLYNGIGYYVRCEGEMCDVFSGYFDTPEEAISAWNVLNKEAK